eukprot:TRINITY_DN48414_c0_g1_i1.p1 TRINITY_DN48414_c0_g1~~TRINITY_DN48414_c0_g1_i1.p1  ORF type:complete len:655 (-),score=127.78 TRINITY_DN48414_c0_g1_i1:234-2147(-)
MATTVATTALPQICRRRLLEGMVHKMLGSGAVAGVKGKVEMRPMQPGEARDKRKHPYIVLIADPVTARMIQSSSEMHDLLREGICLIETIDSERQALPMLDALYFITPTRQNVELLVKDAEGKSHDQKPGPMYRSFHVFFSHRLDENLLSVVAAKPAAAKLMNTFAELNMSFSVFDERSFHLGQNEKLQLMFKHKAMTEEELKDTANRLATVLVSLGETQRIAFYNGRRNPSSGCDKLATQVRSRLTEMETRGMEADEAGPKLNITLLILDRTVDWTTALTYDMKYEAVINDVRGPDTKELEECKFTYQDSADNSDKTVQLSAEKDRYYGQFRHQPLWQVNVTIVDGIRAWQERDAAMRERTAQSQSASMGQMVSSTLAALQALPEHKDTFAKLHNHSVIGQRCVQLVENNDLVNVATMMNDLACNMDQDTNKLVDKDVEAAIRHILESPSLSADTKVRLLLCYALSDLGKDAEDKIDSLASLLEKPDDELHKSPAWKKNQNVFKEDFVAKRRLRARELLANGSVTPRSKNLCRWEPRILDYIQEAAKGNIESVDFKLVPEKKQARSSGATRQAVVVFVVGGICSSEVRIAHEAARTLDTEVFVGGSCMLTPSLVLKALRETVRPPKPTPTVPQEGP